MIQKWQYHNFLFDAKQIRGDEKWIVDHPVNQILGMWTSITSSPYIYNHYLFSVATNFDSVNAYKKGHISNISVG